MQKSKAVHVGTDATIWVSYLLALLPGFGHHLVLQSLDQWLHALDHSRGLICRARVLDHIKGRGKRIGLGYQARATESRAAAAHVTAQFAESVTITFKQGHTHASNLGPVGFNVKNLQNI
jgi:hypothetical protein